MGVGYLLAVYVHCKINFEKKLNQKSENILRLNFEAVQRFCKWKNLEENRQDEALHFETLTFLKKSKNCLF